MTMTQAVDSIVTPQPTELQRKTGMRKRTKVAPELIDPVAELRRLVNMHKNWTQKAGQLEHMARDITIRTGDRKGQVIPCTMSEASRHDLRAAAKKLRGECAGLESAMKRELKKTPIYQEFLGKVWGFGPVVSAYLVAMVDIHKAPNVSNLIHYCGNNPDPATGRLEKRRAGGSPKAAGGTGTYNDELRCRLWQAMLSMRKNSAKSVAGRPHGTTTKYLTRWTEAVHTRKTSGRELGAYKAGRMKTTDLFLWDLYLMWRTLEGLTVRPDKFSALRGRYHNGQEARDTLMVLTLDEARAAVGNVGPVAASAPPPEPDELDKEAEERLDAELGILESEDEPMNQNDQRARKRM
jgi:hypothetical protein